MQFACALFEGAFGAQLMALAGIVLVVTGCIVFLNVAFRVKWWLGVACLLWPGALLFSAARFKKAKLSLLVLLVSAGICTTTFVLRSATTSEWYQTDNPRE